MRIQLAQDNVLETTDVSESFLRDLKANYTDRPDIVAAIDEALQKGEFLRDEKNTSDEAERKRRRTQEKETVQTTATTTTSTTSTTTTATTGRGSPEKKEEDPVSGPEPEKLESNTGIIHVVGEQHDPKRREEEIGICVRIGWALASETDTIVIDPQLRAVFPAAPEKKRKFGEDDGRLPIESRIVKALFPALELLVMLRVDIWKNKFRPDPAPFTYKTRVGQVVDLMKILLAAGDTVDLSPVGNRELFVQATTTYQDPSEINRAAENYASGEDLVKYVTKALNLLRVLARREYATLGMDQQAAVTDALAAIEAEQKNPTWETSLERTSRARSLIMYGLLQRGAPGIGPKNWLVKIGVNHAGHLARLGPLPANVRLYATEQDFRKAVPDFR